MERQNFSSGAEWEDIVGYSRVVKIGNSVEVTGTVAVKNGKVIASTMYEQARCCLEIIEEYLEKAGASLEDVIRTRIYVTDINQWRDVGRAHKEFFGNIRPATSMVEVSALISPEYLVEVEASAILP